MGAFKILQENKAYVPNLTRRTSLLTVNGDTSQRDKFTLETVRKNSKQSGSERLIKVLKTRV